MRKSEFIEEHGTAIPINLGNDLIAVVKQTLINNEPSLWLSTKIGEIPVFEDEVQIVSGDCLDPDEWDIALKDCADGLRKLADAIEAWRKGKPTKEFLDEFGFDEDEE